MINWLLKLFVPEALNQDMAKGQGLLNGYKTYLAAALVIVQKGVIPLLIALIHLSDQLTALQGVGALLGWLQAIHDNPDITAAATALGAFGLGHKADKVIAAVTPPPAAPDTKSA